MGVASLLARPFALDAGHHHHPYKQTFTVVVARKGSVIAYRVRSLHFVIPRISVRGAVIEKALCGEISHHKNLASPRLENPILDPTALLLRFLPPTCAPAPDLELPSKNHAAPLLHLVAAD